MHIIRLILALLKGEATPDEERELREWRRRSPRNERHYQEFVRLWSLTEGGDSSLVPGPRPSAREIVEEAADASRSSPAPLPADLPPRGRSPGWSWAARAAAVVVLLVGGFLLSRLWPEEPAPLALGADEFVTGASETATVSLRDGTVVRLAPDSRLLLSGTIEDRQVELRGRAYIAVAPDDARPFRIRTKAGFVTVLGTRFDLQAIDEDMRLVVVEGRVSVSARGREQRVDAGELSRVVDGMLVPSVRVPDVAPMVDWVGSFLAFQRTPLERAAREIERAYEVEVEIADPALAERTVTAWFTDRTLDQVMRIVCAAVVAQCSRIEEGVRIEPVPPGITVDTRDVSGS